MALSETHRPHSFLIFTSHKRRTARGASGGSLHHRPVFSQALWRALLPCLSSFVPTYLGSLLVEPTFPLCDNLVTTERHCTRAPLSRQRRMSTLALCASARAARQHAERGESFFLPPTHTDAGILLRGIVGRSSADSIGFGLTFVCGPMLAPLSVPVLLELLLFDLELVCCNFHAAVLSQIRGVPLL